MSMPRTPLHVTPLHPLFAAEVTGLDLRQTPGPELCAEIDRLMDRYAVLVLPGQAIDDDQQMAFGEALGPLEQDRAVVDVHKVRLKHHNMADISNLDVDGQLLAVDDRRRMFNLGNRLWHSDSSFKAGWCLPAARIPSSPTCAPPGMRCRLTCR